MKPRLQKTEGGSGGKRGHHGMAHYEYTEVIKATVDRLRRRQDRVLTGEQMLDYAAEDDIGNRCPRCGPGPCDPEAHEIDVILFLAGLPLDTTEEELERFLAQVPDPLDTDANRAQTEDMPFR